MTKPTKLCECWYKDVCEQHHDDCRPGCLEYKEMLYLMSHSNIPPRLQKPLPLMIPKSDTSAYSRLTEIKQDMRSFVRGGNSLYICSTMTGNGKTTWALKLLMRYFEEIKTGNCFRIRGVFVPTEEFLLRNKDFKNNDPELEDLKDAIKTADLVVWDDIGSANSTAYDYNTMLMYLDIRDRNGLSNIFTSNHIDMDSLGAHVGVKCASRVFTKGTEVIQFVGRDRR